MSLFLENKLDLSTIDVSIIIVCMNNAANLRICLPSIKKFTSISSETLVVAYLFDKDTLRLLREEFEWVTFIESNEIRGFSENNNLALSIAKGKYCFVMNDDTKFAMPCIDRLVCTIKNLPERVAVISPISFYGNGDLQSCGRPRYTIFCYFLSLFRLYHEQERKSAYVNQTGIFKSYNISGAFFLIKTDIFRKLGGFDEHYFFCPEDMVLSTLLNKLGYECWVDTHASIIHYEGMSGKSLSMIQTATKPASVRGMLIWLSNNNVYRQIFLSFLTSLSCLCKALFHYVKSAGKKETSSDYIIAIAFLNSVYACFSTKTPKEIFKYYYKKIKN